MSTGRFRKLDVKSLHVDSPTSTPKREIDQHVYRRYGLTPEEIKIVEANIKRTHETAAPCTMSPSTF